MKTGIWVLVLAMLFGTDLLACGDTSSANGCAAEYKYAWEMSPPSDGVTEIAFAKMLEMHPMRALFDGDEKTFWMTEPEYVRGGIQWSLSSHSSDLIIEGIRILGGCAMDEGAFEDQNRIKTIEFTFGDKTKRIHLKNEKKLQEFLFKKPFNSRSADFKVLSVYPGKKNRVTCISELQYITKNKGIWPNTNGYLFETVGAQYTYPNYGLYFQGKQIGYVGGEAVGFDWNEEGYVVLSDGRLSRDFLFGHISKFRGDISIDFDKDDPPLPKGVKRFPLQGQGEVSTIGWVNKQFFCAALCEFEYPIEKSTIFLFENVKGNLKLRKTKTYPNKEIVDSFYNQESLKYCPEP